MRARRSVGYRTILGRARCCATASPIGVIRASSPEPEPVHATADRAAADLRRSGRHRDRERAAVHGARGPQPRADRVARAADGDRRDPAGHLRARRPTSSRCMDAVAESAARFCGARDAIIFRLEGESSGWSRTHGPCPGTMRRSAGPDHEPRDRAGRRAVARAAKRSMSRTIAGAAGDGLPEHAGRVSAQLGLTPRSDDARHAARYGKACPCGVILMRRRQVRPFTDKQIELAKTLRRPGGDRHRERAPVHGARGPEPRSD